MFPFSLCENDILLQHVHQQHAAVLFLTRPHLIVQSGELAEGDDEIVKHITEAIVRSYHCTFPAKKKKNTKHVTLHLKRTNVTLGPRLSANAHLTPYSKCIPVLPC